MRKKRRSVSTRVLVMLGAVLVIVGGAIGGSVAWLTDTTDAVTNTFTVGNIDAYTTASAAYSLRRSTGELRMVPGHTLTINAPAITIGAGSEDCYLFVRIDENLGTWTKEGRTFQDCLSYATVAGWTKLESTPEVTVPDHVYWRVVERDAENDQTFQVIAGESGPEVTVSLDITKEMMSELNEPGATLPTLTFSAYAVQLYSSNDKTFSPADAWAIVSTPSTPSDVNG